MLEDYADAISKRAYTPREYLEAQLKMTPEEQRARQVFFEELFYDHNNPDKKESLV
jgi:hypothetical protein